MAQRKRVHDNDLTADLDGEMRGIVVFLDAVVPAGLWPNARLLVYEARE
jgi:hypothetical protein